MPDDKINKSAQKERIIALIEKVSIFSDLAADDRRRLLSACTKVTLKTGDILCSQGGESTAMFILLFGKLAVRITNSPVIATIDPVTSIGEMGVFTREPRSASVEAIEESALLRLAAEDLNRFIEQEPGIGVKIMRKIIRILADRVSADNTRIREFQNYIVDRDSPV